MLENMIKKEEEERLKQEQAEMELYQPKDQSGSEKSFSQRSDEEDAEKEEGRKWEEENREGAASNVSLS